MTPTPSHAPDAAQSVPAVQAFLVALASGDPTPGGGAAAALGGALAAALVAMVSRATAARDLAARDEMTAIATRADQLREHLTALVARDMEAYRSVLDARRSRQPDEAARALRRATDVPLMVVRDSQSVLTVCETVATRARASTLSDLGVAAALGWAALEAGALTARTNLGDLQDAAFVEASERELAGLLTSGHDVRTRTLDTIAARMNVRVIHSDD
jgi:formiminotetrahydrofolate cyclodeaminase